MGRISEDSEPDVDISYSDMMVVAGFVVVVGFDSQFGRREKSAALD